MVVGRLFSYWEGNFSGLNVKLREGNYWSSVGIFSEHLLEFLARRRRTLRGNSLNDDCMRVFAKAETGMGWAASGTPKTMG